MPSLIDLTGQTFGRLTVLRRGSNLRRGFSRWMCRCSCGQRALVWSSALRSGHTQSCGCLMRERLGDANRTHGLRRHPLYGRWHRMVSRCFDPRNKSFKDYGGRGITVAPQWREVSCYLRDVEQEIGPLPFPAATIDRIDNDGHYAPGNIRWATRKMQANNRRPLQ